MHRGLLAVALLTVALTGCVGEPSQGPDLADLGAELTVHTEAGPCRIPTSIAQETGLLVVASDAIAGIQGVHKRAFLDGQIQEILDESRYVHVAFPQNTTVELPSYPEVEARSFSDLYLIWNTTAGVDNVLSSGGEYGTTYPMELVEDRAREAIRAACPDGQGAAEGPYRLARIHGEERLEPQPESYDACDIRFDHSVDVENRTLVYRAEGYAFDPANVSRMVAATIWDRPSQCPEVYQLFPNVNRATLDVGVYGPLNVSFEQNGTLHVADERWLGPGEDTTITYSERVEEDGRERWRNGTIHVAYFEGWPRSGIQARGD